MPPNNRKLNLMEVFFPGKKCSSHSFDLSKHKYQLSMVPSFEPILDLFPFGMPSAVRLVADPEI